MSSLREEVENSPRDAVYIHKKSMLAFLDERLSRVKQRICEESNRVQKTYGESWDNVVNKDNVFKILEEELG